jgi:hypothetical protein
LQNTKTYINNTLKYIQNQQSVIWLITLNSNTYTSALFCPINQKIIYLREYVSNTKITKDHLLEAQKETHECNISKLIVGIDDERFVILPNSITEPYAQKIAIQQVHEVLENDLVFADIIAWQSMQNVYILKGATVDVMHSLLSNTHLTNINTCLLYFALNSNKLINNSVFVHFGFQSVCITAFKNKQLQLHNKYQSSNLNDTLYYVQKCISTLGLENLNIIISGIDTFENIIPLSEIYDNVSIAELPTGIINDDLNEKEMQHFFNLYCLINQCV